MKLNFKTIAGFVVGSAVGLCCAWLLSRTVTSCLNHSRVDQIVEVLETSIESLDKELPAPTFGGMLISAKYNDKVAEYTVLVDEAFSDYYMSEGSVEPRVSALTIMSTIVDNLANNNLLNSDYTIEDFCRDFADTGLSIRYVFRDKKTGHSRNLAIDNSMLVEAARHLGTPSDGQYFENDFYAKYFGNTRKILPLALDETITWIETNELDNGFEYVYTVDADIDSISGDVYNGIRAGLIEGLKNDMSNLCVYKEMAKTPQTITYRYINSAGKNIAVFDLKPSDIF